MTLTTRVAIVEPTAVRAVFDAARALIGAQDAEYKHEEPSKYWNDGRCRLGNIPGQGYHALIWVYYGADAPLRPDPLHADDPDERRGYPPVDEWSIEVCFDTGYAYRSENGAGCSDLHAYLVRELGCWLDEQGLTWYWLHEFSGEWHPSSDPVTLLGDPERGRLAVATP